MRDGAAAVQFTAVWWLRKTWSMWYWTGDNDMIPLNNILITAVADRLFDYNIISG